VKVGEVDNITDPVLCVNSGVLKYFDLFDTLSYFGLPTSGFSWLNPYTILLLLSKICSPITPSMTFLTLQLYLITLPIF
jgi:hypothetical protein